MFYIFLQLLYDKKPVSCLFYYLLDDLYLSLFQLLQYLVLLTFYFKNDMKKSGVDLHTIFCHSGG